MLRIAPFQRALNPEILKVNTFKRIDIPDNILPWLDIEYGLSRLAEFVPDARTRLVQGLLFNREIGTKAAVQRASSWLGLDVDLWEEPEPTIHFPEYQLKLLSEIPVGWEQLLCKLWRLLKIAQPLRSRFKRVFNDYWNLPHFVLDSSQWGDLLSTYSGVPLDGYNKACPCGKTTNLVISIGRLISLSDQGHPIHVLTDNPVLGNLARERVLTNYVTYDKWPILDDEWYYLFNNTHMSAKMGYRREVPSSPSPSPSPSPDAVPSSAILANGVNYLTTADGNPITYA